MMHAILFKIGAHCDGEVRFCVSFERDIDVQAGAMYEGIYSDVHIMPLSEAESRGLVRRHCAPETYARGIFRRCRHGLYRIAQDTIALDKTCDMWFVPFAKALPLGPDEHTLENLTQVIDDFLTEYTADSLRTLVYEGCCFDYLMTMLANEERRFPQFALIIDNTFRILERVVAWEARDRIADVALTTKLRRDGLPLRCATGWVCDASGITGLEDADGDPCA